MTRLEKLKQKLTLLDTENIQHIVHSERGQYRIGYRKSNDTGYHPISYYGTILEIENVAESLLVYSDMYHRKEKVKI